jgi:uncharacterized membrane protein YkvA (DUF1232 family)
MIGNQLLGRVSGGRIQRRGRIAALTRLPTLLRVCLPLFRDPRVPLWQRGAVLAFLALVFSPLDFIGDIPVVGQFWDITLAVTALEFFVQWAPSDVVDEHLKRLGLENKFPHRMR